MGSAINRVLRKWLEHNRTGYLLIDRKGQPLGSNGTTKALARIGLKHFDKRLGSSLLRHSYLSHKYAQDSKEKSKDADLMMHSVQMQNAYIKS